MDICLIRIISCEKLEKRETYIPYIYERGVYATTPIFETFLSLSSLANIYTSVIDKIIQCLENFSDFTLFKQNVYVLETFSLIYSHLNGIAVKKAIFRPCIWRLLLLLYIFKGK